MLGVCFLCWMVCVCSFDLLCFSFLALLFLVLVFKFLVSCCCALGVGCLDFVFGVWGLCVSYVALCVLVLLFLGCRVVFHVLVFCFLFALARLCLGACVYGSCVEFWVVIFTLWLELWLLVCCLWLRVSVFGLWFWCLCFACWR